MEKKTIFLGVFFITIDDLFGIEISSQKILSQEDREKFLDLINYKIQNPNGTAILFLRNTTKSYTSYDYISTLIFSTNKKYDDRYSPHTIEMSGVYMPSLRNDVNIIDRVKLSITFTTNNDVVNHISSVLLGREDRITVENTGNKTTTISSSSTDTQYPSAAAVYNFVIGTPTFKTFPSDFVTNSTTQDFFDSVYASDPDDGSVYLGSVTLSDLPSGIANAEIELYVYPNSVYYAILRSTNVSPYLWQANSHTFRGWEPIDKTAKDYTDAQIGNALQASY